MKPNVIKELIAINDNIHELLNYCETLAQLSKLAEIQQHVINLKNILEEK